MKQLYLYIASLLFLMASGLGDAREANKAYEEGNYATADSLYRLAIEADPENAQLYFNLGNALAKQGLIQEAIETYLQYESMAATPEDMAKAQYNIGTVLGDEEQWKPAAAHFRNALRLNPNDPEAMHNYEIAAKKAREEENEQQQQQQNPEQEPPEPSEYAKAMKKQAEKLVSERKYQEAYDLMQRALEADETVQAFNAFIERIGNVDQINS